MADFADEGSDATEYQLTVAIQNHANRARAGVRPFTGFCHYCKETVSSPSRFCDNDCKDDQMYEEQRITQLRV